MKTHDTRGREADTDLPESESALISVHGTFASAASNEGEKWWQRGSSFSRRIRNYLPPGVCLARDEEAFRWSGKNSERARSQAARELLEHLKQQDSAGKSYHLVGHSHGGSVIWQALKLATHSKIPLRGLRSWTTVGTPFLQHRSRAVYSPSNILALLLAALLLKPAIRYAMAVCGVCQAAIVGDKPEMIAKDAGTIGYEAYLREPLFWLIDRIGVPIVTEGGQTRIGTFDPLGDQSFASYLFASYEGLVLLLVVILSSYLLLNLALHSLMPVIESFRIRAEHRLENDAFHRFGGRWLGIWSRDDEAINGLRATLEFSASFVREMAPRQRVFISDTPSLLYRPIFWIIAPIFNRAIRPFADEFVRRIVLRSAQGNDRPTAELVEVTPTPTIDAKNAVQPIPSALNVALLEYSDNHARDIAPKLRTLISQSSFALGLEAFGQELSGKELIHTAYFDHDAIAMLVGYNVTAEESTSMTPQQQFSLDSGLQAWGSGLKSWFSENKLRLPGNESRLPGWVYDAQHRHRQPA